MKTTMESSLKETEQRLQEKLTKHENNINEKIEKIEAKMHAMEDSLKKSVQTNEDNIRNEFKDLKNQLISKMDHIQQQQMAEAKTYQETTQTELIKLGENKKTLDTLKDLEQNIKGKLNNMFLNLIKPVGSCRQALYVSGTYMIQVGVNTKPFEVFCEQNKFDGGWIVIQHRFDGSIDFYRNWTEYRNGFGMLDGEFWLGLEYVHQITKNRPHELMVEVKDFHGNYGYAKYDAFEIGSETESYALKKLGTYSGTAGDSMQDNKDEKFSTFDRDNDKWGFSCAEQYHGAWWYYYCTFANLNGRYLNSWDDDSAMEWYELKEDFRGLSYSRMMIRDIIN
ncbi:hypothetical protein ZHAS_00008545 [Anopheles sinensis]|uniref:Fibrinogen C-terminal domain-containing protein n=1 Tax=Anopheles sinensis TaxID=74873 RepID=A0A084VSZ5_ANOSI|nr:hypothetical protein ZHAS_00008545 [Anopheles sinensis]